MSKLIYSAHSNNKFKLESNNIEYLNTNNIANICSFEALHSNNSIKN